MYHKLHQVLETLAVGFQNIGVDIESYRPKILNIKPKFINKEENYFMKSNDIKIWG